MRKSITVLLCAILICGLFCGCKEPDFKSQKYDNAVAYVNDGDFEKALNIFASDYSLRSYDDGKYYNYAKARVLFGKGLVSKAYESFLLCSGFKDSSDYLLALERFFDEIEGRYNSNIYGQPYFISFDKNVATVGVEGKTQYNYDIVTLSIATEGTMVFSVGFYQSADESVDEHYMISLSSDRSKLTISTAAQSGETAFCGEYTAS